MGPPSPDPGMTVDREGRVIILSQLLRPDLSKSYREYSPLLCPSPNKYWVSKERCVEVRLAADERLSEGNRRSNSALLSIMAPPLGALIKSSALSRQLATRCPK